MFFARVIAVSVLAAGVLAPASAPAQSYPNRPVTLIVPFPPGGATDAIARIVQDSMTQSLGQQIVIENVGGAGGMIAAGRAARAAPDGYTVLLHQVALAVAKTLYPGLSFDPAKDFVAIGPVNTAASTIAARPGLPPTTLAELVGWLKQPGQKARIAHPGVGSFGHLCGVLFAQEVGAQVDQIPYRGAGPALNDLLAGHADLGCQSAVVAEPLIKAGKIKAYAIVGRARFDGLPELPTLGEQGYRKLDVDFWHMLFAPAATPRPIVDRLNAALRHALSDPKVTETFARSGMQLYPESEWSPEAGAALLRGEIKRWAEVIRANHISTQ